MTFLFIFIFYSVFGDFLHLFMPVLPADSCTDIFSINWYLRISMV